MKIYGIATIIYTHARCGSHGVVRIEWTNQNIDKMSKVHYRKGTILDEW